MAAAYKSSGACRQAPYIKLESARITNPREWIRLIKFQSWSKITL